MEPTLHDKDRLLCERLSLAAGGPARGDVVVLANPTAIGENLVKRVVGVAGDVVEVGGERFPVPEGHVLVLGDNRGRSRDSREFGPVPLRAVRGVARWRCWPPSRFGPVR